MIVTVATANMIINATITAVLSIRNLIITMIIVNIATASLITPTTMVMLSTVLTDITICESLNPTSTVYRPYTRRNAENQ